MSKISVLDVQGEKAGELEIADELMVLTRGRQTLHDAVVAYRANQRVGGASTKTKGEVTGAGSKPWKQKGTGRARAGYRSSPIWRGGGVAFGPRPRDFGKRLTKKAGRLAFARAISERIQDGALVVVEDLVLDQPKTKLLWSRLQKLGVQTNGLIVVDETDSNIELAVRNIPKVELVRARDLNTYQAVRYSRLIVTRKAMEHLQGRLEQVVGKERVS